MNRELLIKIILSCTLLLSPGLFAKEKMSLTLESSVDYALKQNPDIKIAEKQLAKARAGVWEAYSTVLPQFDATANFQHAWLIQETTIPNFIKAGLGPLAPPETPDYIRIAFALENTFTYGASVSQPLFLGGAGIAGIQSAAAARRIMSQDLESRRQNLIYNAANAFYSCLLTKKLITVQEEALRQAQANFDVVNKKYQVGVASGFDKMRAQVDVANLQPAVITARNNYQSALTNLRTILGLDRETEIEVSGEFSYVEDEFNALTLSQLQEMAAQNRPELKALTQQKVISRKAMTIARSAFLPKLYFTSDYSFMANKNDLKLSQDDFSRGFTTALSLQIPLFHGFRSCKQYQKSRLDYKITLDTERQAENGINAEVEVAYNKFMEAKEKFQSAKETVDLAEESLRLANLMYNEGTNTQLDVLNSQLAKTQAQMNYVSSLYEYQVARYQLRKVTGVLTGVL